MIEIYASERTLTITKEVAPWPGTGPVDVVSVTTESGEEIARFNLTRDLAEAIAEQLVPDAPLDVTYESARAILR
jgi:hypothetical protein